MRILVGLGNPGPDYERTRHNLGFRVLDALAARHSLSYGLVRHACAAAEGEIGGVAVALVKPLAYMNRSGEALAGWMRGRGLAFAAPRDEDDGSGDTESEGMETEGLEPPLIVCDDIALPLGAARLRARGGAGGHNGLVSLIAALGGEDFPRLRLGVAPPDGAVPPEDWSEYVLGDFGDEAWAASEDLVAHGVEALECVLAEGLEIAGGRFNRKTPPEMGSDGCISKDPEL